MAGVECRQFTGFLAVYRCDGQIGSAVFAHMASRCDGGANPSFCAYSCGHHGYSGCIFGVPDVTFDGIRARGDGICDFSWRFNRLFCRHCWPGSKRYQARHCLFNLFSAWLYVRRRGRGCIFGRHVPPVHACVFQSHAVFGGGICDPCNAS